MFRLVKPTLFFRELSGSPRLKFSMAWLTFMGLVIPTALLTSMGIRQEYALPLLLVSILPFQYIAFCVLYGAKAVGQTTQIGKRSPGSLPTIRDFESLAARLNMQAAPLVAEPRLLDALLWSARTRAHLLARYDYARYERITENLDAELASASAGVAQGVVSAFAGVAQGVASASAVQRMLLASYSRHYAELAEAYQNSLSSLFDVAYRRKRYSDTMIRLQRGALDRPPPPTEQSRMLVPSSQGTMYTIGSTQLA